MQKGLIRYASESGIKNKTKLTFTKRMKAYSLVLLVLISLETFLLATRSDYDATVLRAKGMLYQERDNERISNLYTIKLVNKTRDSLPVKIVIPEYPNSEIELIGKSLYTRPENVTQGEFFVYLDKKDIKNRKSKIKIDLYSNNKKIKTVETTFLGPVGK